MLKLAGVLAALALFGASPALAQPPEIVDAEGQIEVGVGESKTLRFQRPFQSTGTVTPDIAHILPRSDTMLTISGVTPGQTLFYVNGPNGEVIYTATITVGAGAGHIVKIYHRKTKDFVAVYCNETGCGRADLDRKLANGRDPDEPTAQSTTVITPTGGGGSVSTTRQYGP